MKAKEYLNQLPKLSARIDELQEEIQRIDSYAERCTTNWNSCRGTNIPTDRVSNSIARKEELIDKYFSLEIMYQELFCTISDQISELNTTSADLLFYRYIKGENFSTISHWMKHPYSYVLNLHQKALSDFQKAYSKELSHAEKLT